MNILALQLKRIGDAILTAPALAAVKAENPGASITLVLEGAAGPLGPAFSSADEVLVYRRHRMNPAVWARIAGGPYDLCLDFTSSDRSAVMGSLSRARVRAGYSRYCVRRPAVRRAYTTLSNASVRDLPTVEFHLALAAHAGAARSHASFDPEAPAGFAAPASLTLPDLPDRFALLHPGTARSEKFWFPERWAAVIEELARNHGLHCVLTGGSCPEELNHIRAIRAKTRTPFADLSGALSLLELASVIERAGIVLSVDSAAAHLAAMARRPQVTLFGPTNPFHWAPRHHNSLVVSAPGDQMVQLDDLVPRAPGAPMRHLSTSTVIRATGSLLAR